MPGCHLYNAAPWVPPRVNLHNTLPCNYIVRVMYAFTGETRCPMCEQYAIFMIDLRPVSVRQVVCAFYLYLRYLLSIIIIRTVVGACGRSYKNRSYASVKSFAEIEMGGAR